MSTLHLTIIIVAIAIVLVILSIMDQKMTGRKKRTGSKQTKK